MGLFQSGLFRRGSARSDRQGLPLPGPSSLTALCAIARFHQISAEPAALAHQLGLSASQTFSSNDLLRAAQQLGLKARHIQSTVLRLAQLPLPALAFVRDGEAGLRVVVLAQSDGQRVLYQDMAAQGAEGGRPTIEPAETFAQRWTGDLILIASRASAGGRAGQI